MRILLYGLNYSPELTGIGKYSGEMGEWLAARGHDIRVVTAPPYYPNWRIDPPYRGDRYKRQSGMHGERIYRCPLYVPNVPSGVKRILHLFSFALSSLPILLGLSGWKPDVIFMVEPTFFCAPIALLAGMALNARCWLHIQDFEVDAAFELGLLPSDGALHKCALSLEGFLTRRFDYVSSISHDMLERSRNKGVAAGKTLLFPNWVDTDEIHPTNAPSRYREELALQGKLVLLYSGNLGNKQGLEVLDPLCESFRDHADVHFLICGDGSLRPHLEEFAATHPNLTLLQLQPIDRLNELLNTADIHLLPQRTGAADLVMPSKLTGMLASGRPVISTALSGTQVARVINPDPANDLGPLGLLVPPDDMQALRSAILHLKGNIELRHRMGAAARHFAENYMGKEILLRRFESSLIALVNGSDVNNQGSRQKTDNKAR